MSCNVLLSFLGATKYNPCYYKSANSSAFLSNSPVMATFSHLSSKVKNGINHLVIAGTSTSYWGDLHYYLSSYIKENKDANYSISEMTCNKTEYDEDKLHQLESQLNDNFGKILDLKISLVIHERYSRTYDEQFSLIKKLEGVIKPNSNVFLDITNGLRIMPLVSYASLLCFMHTKCIKIKNILYSKMSVPMPDRSGKVETVNNWINCLNALAQDARTDLVNSKLDELDKILPPILQRSSSISPDKPSMICEITEPKEYLSTAAKFNIFMNTGDVRAFSNENNIKADKDINNLGYLLDTCNYHEAKDCIQDALLGIKNNIHDDFCGTFAKNVLTKFGHLENTIDFKNLAAHYLATGDYIHAINALYHAISSVEFKSSKNNFVKKDTFGKNNSFNDEKNKQVMAIKYKYHKEGVTAWGNLIDIYRALEIHKEDKTQAFNNPDSKLFKSVVDKETGNISERSFDKSLRECFANLGVNVVDYKEQIVGLDSKPKNVLFTFLGAGDYVRTNYIFQDPQNKESCKYSLKNSLFIGTSLIDKLVQTDSLSVANICGTYSS